MTDYKFVVMTNPVEGREDEYNAWYDGPHLADVLKLPGFVAARRFEEASPFEAARTSYRYLTIYDIETDDIEETLNGLFSTAGGGGMFISEALDKTVQMTVFRARGPAKQKAEG